MISKLRKKVILINLVSIIIVFFVAITLIFTSGYRRIAEERKARFNNILEYDSWDNVEPDHYRGVVLVEYNPRNDEVLRQSVSSDVKLSLSEIDKITEQILDEPKDDGWINGRVQYVKKTQGDVTRIVIYDRYTNAGNVKLYVWLSLTALLVGSLCYLVISYILARIALKSVEESWKKQKQFLADASHELKTPLSVIMANTEIIASHGNETVASQQKWIENTRSESERMAELVNDLLFLAKNDDGLKAQMDVVNLSECIETIALTHEAVLYENGKSFNYSIAPDLQVKGNEGQLKQLATILLDNANKYSINSGNIQLGVEIVGKNAQITVANDCDEISDDQLKHLFDRFYTVDQSRSKSHAGNGLGLSIAQVITKTHRGKISAEYKDGRITFVTVLPLYKSK